MARHACVVNDFVELLYDGSTVHINVNIKFFSCLLPELERRKIYFNSDVQKNHRLSNRNWQLKQRKKASRRNFSSR